ncbi:uncharacterized protein V6R79_022587 [Siganus canaliculatus]
MNEPDTAAILSHDALASNTGSINDYGPDEEEKETEADVPTTVSSPWKCSLPVSVEPVIFLGMFAVSMQAPLVTQYLWDRISEDLGYDGSKTSRCSNASLPQDPLEKEVETLTAHWNVYINLTGFAVCLFVVPLLGSWSDLAGRRPVLIIPNLGLALQAAIYLVVMYLKLPVAYFLVGRIISGLTGDFNAVLAGCFSYVADVSDRRSRTFRVAILEACLGISGMLASIIGGQWRQAQGYINPFWLVVASNLASALYAYFFVRESIPSNPGARLLTFRHYKAVWHIFSTGGCTAEAGQRYHRCHLWLYMLSFFLVGAVHFGCRDLFSLFELSSPLCWDSTLIGYGSAALNLGYLSSLLWLKLMQRCLLDPWAALVGLISNITGLAVSSIADTTLLMFIGYGLGLLYVVPMPVIRSKLSKLVEPSEQGALFASVACVQSLSLLVGISLFSALFPVTLHFMKGFPFLVAAMILFIPAGIIGTLQCLDQKKGRRDSAAS